VIAPGVVSETPAGLVDIVPTICGLLEIAPPAGVHLDGSDLSPLLRGAEADFVRHQPLFWHLQRSRPLVAMREGDWSLVAEPDYELSDSNMFEESWIPKIRAGGYRGFQLFNLKTDRAQTTDLSAQEPARLAAMKAQLLEINASVMAEATDWNEVE
jgi:arylsulfatase A